MLPGVLRVLPGVLRGVHFLRVLPPAHFLGGALLWAVGPLKIPHRPLCKWPTAHTARPSYAC